MKCCGLGYDQGVILINVLGLCLAAAATGLLVYKKPPDHEDTDVKLIVVLALLIGCMLVNLVMVVRTLLCSKSRIHLLLRLLVSVVGTILLIACAAFVIESAMMEAEAEIPDEDTGIILWTIAALIIVNALLCLLDSLVILRFYLYTMFRDTGDY